MKAQASHLCLSVISTLWRLPLFLAATLAAFALVACDDSGEDAGSSENGSGDDPIMWIQNSATPDGAASAFMAFSAEVPTQVFDRSRMIELGQGTGDAFNGMVFTYDFEALTITRWQLSDTLEPTPAEVIGLANEGVAPWWKNAFYSDTRAFIFNLPAGEIVEWNPRDMAITARHQVEPLENPGAHTGNAYRSGDRFLLPIGGHNWETLELDPVTVVAIFDPEQMTVTYATDDRAPSTFEAFVAENGDFYALPDRATSYLRHYFAPDVGGPPGGLIRIKAGEDEFDPDYYERLDELAGGRALAQIFPVTGTKWLVEALPDISEYPPLERAEELFEMPVSLRLVDLEQRTWQPVTGLEEPRAGMWTNERRFYVDGALYYAGALFFPGQAFTRVDVDLGEVTVEAFRSLFTTSNTWPLVFKRVSSGSRSL